MFQSDSTLLGVHPHVHVHIVSCKTILQTYMYDVPGFKYYSYGEGIRSCICVYVDTL